MLIFDNFIELKSLQSAEKSLADASAQDLHELSIPSVSMTSRASNTLSAMAIASPERHVRLLSPNLQRPHVTKTGSYHPEVLPSIWNPMASTRSASRSVNTQKMSIDSSDSMSQSPSIHPLNVPILHQIFSRSRSPVEEGSAMASPKTSRILTSRSHDFRSLESPYATQKPIFDAASLDRQFEVYRQALQKAER
jgi:hypothetical protein